MVDYIRFEVYVPRIYEAENSLGEKEVHSLPPELIQSFIDDTIQNYGGVMQANPHAPTPYKGWWYATHENKIIIDSLTYLLVLVRIDRMDSAIEFFSNWKKKLEQATNQDIILVTYYPVQVLGGFL